MDKKVFLRKDTIQNRKLREVEYKSHRKRDKEQTALNFFTAILATVSCMASDILLIFLSNNAKIKKLIMQTKTQEFLKRKFAV